MIALSFIIKIITPGNSINSEDVGSSGFSNKGRFSYSVDITLIVISWVSLLSL
jgi:hypothetical protein